jgi:hypothetical protein
MVCRPDRPGNLATVGWKRRLDLVNVRTNNMDGICRVRLTRGNEEEMYIGGKYGKQICILEP